VKVERAMHVIAVRNLERSSAFYRDVLGFEVHEMGDDGWRVFAKDVCRIMAGECADAATPTAAEIGDHSYFAYLVVDDVDEVYRRVSRSASGGGGGGARQAEIVKPLRDEPWGMRELGVRTVDGHRIMIGQRVAADAPDEVALAEDAPRNGS